MQKMETNKTYVIPEDLYLRSNDELILYARGGYDANVTQYRQIQRLSKLGMIVTNTEITKGLVRLVA